MPAGTLYETVISKLTGPTRCHWPDFNNSHEQDAEGVREMARQDSYEIGTSSLAQTPLKLPSFTIRG